MCTRSSPGSMLYVSERRSSHALLVRQWLANSRPDLLCGKVRLVGVASHPPLNAALELRQLARPDDFDAIFPSALA